MAYTVWKAVETSEATMDNNYYGNICYCRRCNGVVHTIKKGDTLYLISKYYKVPIGEIMNANRNLNIYNLQIGDEICIPVRRPEPINGMMPENDVIMPVNGAGTDETVMNVPDIHEMSDIETMSAEQADGVKNIAADDKLDDILSMEGMTVGEFARLMRKFDE